MVLLRYVKWKELKTTMVSWIALIPAYEPDDRLLNLIRVLCESGFAMIVVVDDGSGEQYAGLFRQAAELTSLVTHTENRGKGRALKTGMTYIKEHCSGEYIVVTLDSDGQHTAADACKVCEAAQQHENALILGSRGLKENTPARSRLGNAVVRQAYSLSTGVCVHDTQTGLRAFSGRLLPVLLAISGERYEYEMNVLLECTRKNIPIIEIEIATIYINNNSGSHFNTIKDSFRVSCEILKFSASSLASFLLDYAMYSLLLALTGALGFPLSLEVSNITARIISASFNYTVNRRLVFKNHGSVTKSALRYVGLAAVILVGNTLMLSLLVETLHLNQYAAKLLTELTFFVLSWLAQKFFVFGKSKVLHEKHA